MSDRLGRSVRGGRRRRRVSVDVPAVRLFTAARGVKRRRSRAGAAGPTIRRLAIGRHRRVRRERRHLFHSSRCEETPFTA